MAEDFAGVALVQASLTDTTDVRRDATARLGSTSFADRAETGIQLLSRWAGILTFACAVAAIAYLIF